MKPNNQTHYSEFLYLFRIDALENLFKNSNNQPTSTHTPTSTQFRSGDNTNVLRKLEQLEKRIDIIESKLRSL